MVCLGTTNWFLCSMESETCDKSEIKNQTFYVCIYIYICEQIPPFFDISVFKVRPKRNVV
jgi:hypothetical protein